MLNKLSKYISRSKIGKTELNTFELHLKLLCLKLLHFWELWPDKKKGHTCETDVDQIILERISVTCS